MSFKKNYDDPRPGINYAVYHKAAELFKVFKNGIMRSIYLYLFHTWNIYFLLLVVPMSFKVVPGLSFLKVTLMRVPLSMI